MLPPSSLTAQDAADEADSIDLKSDVLEWVDELDAASLSKRKAAEKSLIEAGPDALEFLPEKKSGVSIEAAERLARVRKALKSMRTKTQAAAIRIDLSDVTTLGEALEAISRDSGVEFEHDADESDPVDSVATPLSFWHAVDLVLDQRNLDVNFYGGARGTLALVPRDEGRPSRVDSAAYAGVYRIEPTSVNSRRVLNQPDQSGMNISMEIAWEPRLTPIGLTIPIEQLSGKLENDDAIEPQDSGEKIDIATNAEIAFSEFFLPLELPAGRPEKIVSLAGTIEALLPGKSQTFKLSLGESNAKQTIDSMTVEIEEIRKNGPIHEVRVSIKLEDADRALESHRHWIFENPLYIVRKDGSRAEQLGYEIFRQSKDGVGIGYLFELGDAYGDANLIYESPTAVINNEVDFVIQDIPLP
ncbi:MAG: hypothetical protein HKN47_28440 [Pirellulaceae bacterium]|nr:hypothetical protein [Pirellulaceae bacterium]